jgi:hypothetical protein
LPLANIPWGMASNKAKMETKKTERTRRAFIIELSS